MKFTNLLKIKTVFWLSFLILIPTFFSCTKLSVEKQTETQTQFNEPQVENEFDEDIEKREDWFMRQRTYPFSKVPEDARRKAWLSRPQNALGENGLALEPWQPIGPNPTSSGFPNNWGVTSGRINAIAASPSNPQLVLIGAATGGIWRSTNGGDSFAPTSDNQVDLAVGSISFAPSNPSIVYAGMGDKDKAYNGTGVLKSTDGGQSWTRISNSTLPAFGRISKIEVDQNNPNRVYVAQYTSSQLQDIYYGGFFYSTDGGINWIRTLTGIARDLVKHPTQPNTLYLALDEFYNNGRQRGGVFKSTDAGQSWTQIYLSPYFPTSNIKIAVTPSAPQRIYVLTGTEFQGSPPVARLEISTDEGLTWSNRGVAFDTKQINYNCYLFIHPTSPNTIFVGTRDLWLTNDAGNSYYNVTNNFSINGVYQPLMSKAHPDQHYFYISPTNPTTTYIANDGGLWRSTDNTATYQSLNNSLSFTMFTSLALHPTDAAKSYGGTQDNGTQRRIGNSGWEEFSPGDGGQTVIDALDPSIVYITYTNKNITRWRNNGNTNDGQIGYQECSSCPPDTIFNDDRVDFYPPFVGNGVNSNLYFGTSRLYVSTNRGASWTAPGGAVDLTFGGTDTLSAIGVGRSTTNTIYTGSGYGRLAVSTNGGATWIDRTNGLPQRFIKAIIVNQTNANTAYVTVSGYGSGHVFKTVNAGASWTDISGNLPNVPTNTLLIDPNNPTTLYVGTDVGVFRTTTDGNNWATFNDGMPPVIISELDAQASGVIQAATYGRGAFQINLNQICGYALNPTSQSFSGNGGNGNISIITQSGCNWTAASNVSWITVTSGASGSINGTVGFTAAANTTAVMRTGTVTIAGQTFTVTQAGQSCSYTINPTNQSFNYVGGSSSFGVSTNSGCAWQAVSNANWITANNSGTGSGTVGFSVAANSSSSARVGTISLAGNTFTVNQAGQTVVTSRKAFDFDGDGKADVSVFRPSNGVWYLNQSQNGFTGFQFGISSDRIVPADYDGDGKTDLAVYRNGTWFIQRSTAGFTALQFGAADDIPQPADYDGDGKAELAVWRPSTGVWYVYNLATSQTTVAQFGSPGDKPVVGDYNGDGKADYAVFRPSSATWYIARPTGTPSQNFDAIQFGGANDTLVPADYDGDGKTDLAVFRPSNGIWYILGSTTGFTGVQFGISTDLPVAADYDGDGKADVAVYRNGTWYLNQSTRGFTAVVFGNSADKPVPNGFVF